MENDDDNNIMILMEDVLIQILVLLPVISLLRFKSVCKSWRALIQTSFFIDLHLNTTTTTNKNNNLGTFIFQTSRGFRNKRENEAFMLSSSGSSSSSGGHGHGHGEEEEEEELIRLEDLGFPSCYKVSPRFDFLFIVGSCNGLICIHDTKRRDVSLWNPATRQFRLLPKSKSLFPTPLEEEEEESVEEFAAFGYDLKTKDYKVVLISHFRPYTSGDDDRWISEKEYIFQVQVYSLSTNSWRVLEGINSFPALPRASISMNHGVYLKGSYYFLGHYLVKEEFGLYQGTTSHTVILSFDFTKEIFTIIHLPYPPTYHYPNTISTYQGGDKLAVFAQVVVEEPEEYHSDSETYEIWVLNEEHGHEFFKEEEEEKSSSWTKLHQLYSDGRLRGISNNGEFAFVGTGSSSEIDGVWTYDGDKLELFNLVTKQVKNKFSTPEEVIRGDVYNQSLVSIGGGGNNGTT